MTVRRLVVAVRHRPWAVLLLAVLLVVGVAQAAVLLLEPRGGIVTPDDVRASAYFTAEQIARAEAYRAPLVPIHVAQTLIGIVVLAAVARRPPRALAGGGTPLRRHARVALAAAGLAVLLAAAAIPLRIVGRIRGIDVGLITRSWGGWIVDVLMQAAIQAALWALVAVVLVALVRRFPRRWWIAGSGGVAVAAVVLVFVTPLVIDPLFNRFDPLEGPLRADVERLADRAGVDVGEVYVMDASRRTTAANAYVTGLGRSKRVVLYDTLVERYPRDEVRFVVAHELAHQREHDVRGAILFVVIVGPVCLFAVAVAVRRIGPGAPNGGQLAGADGAGPGDGGTGPTGADARLVPALALALAVVVPVVTTVSNQLSRSVEARADSVALRLTDDPDALVDFRRRSTVRNVSDPDPGRLGHVLLGTHPTSVERIGAAEAWRRGVRP